MDKKVFAAFYLKPGFRNAPSQVGRHCKTLSHSLPIKFLLSDRRTDAHFASPYALANIFSTLKFIPFTTLPTILCLHCSLPHFVCEALFSIALVTKNLAACFTLRTSRLRWIWPSELTRLCTNGQLTILYLTRHLDKLYFRFRS